MDITEGRHITSDRRRHQVCRNIKAMEGITMAHRLDTKGATSVVMVVADTAIGEGRYRRGVSLDTG